MLIYFSDGLNPKMILSLSFHPFIRVKNENKVYMWQRAQVVLIKQQISKMNFFFSKVPLMSCRLVLLYGHDKIYTEYFTDKEECKAASRQDQFANLGYSCSDTYASCEGFPYSSHGAPPF